MALPERTCMGPECVRRGGDLGYCGAHYQQWKHLGYLKPLRPYTKSWATPICSVPDCGRPHKARGLCKQHGVHMKKYGETREIKQYYPEGRLCGIKDCGQPAYAKLRCLQHTRYGYNLSRFGLTLETFIVMLDKQGGGCAICGEANPNGNALSVDHDHACCPGGGSCGRCIRGLLCSTCNLAVGQMRDDPARLRAAADYLERTAAREQVAA